MLANRVSLVTGGSRGIGAAVAKRLAMDGFTVIVNYESSVKSADALVAAIKKHGGTAQASQGDVSNPAAVRGLFDSAEATYRGIDVLVNNAGTLQLVSIQETSNDIFDRLVAINLKGVFYCLRETAKRLRNRGRIINFSSSVGALLLPTYGVYAAMKAGVEAMTHALSNELRNRDITVNSVAPGPTATELFLKDKPAAVIEHMVKMATLERLGMPEDIADVVSFLAGPDASWINGQVLRANGGAI